MQEQREDLSGYSLSTGFRRLKAQTRHGQRASRAGLSHPNRFSMTFCFQSRLRQAWFAWLLRRLPPAFLSQNVSIPSVGELHHWLWDAAQLSSVLHHVDFVNVRRATFNICRYVNFPFVPLDIDSNGKPRKKRKSMDVEASKQTGSP